MNSDFGCSYFFLLFLPHLNSAATISDYQGPTGLCCLHKRSEWQLLLEYTPGMRKISTSSLEWHVTECQPYAAVLCPPTRGRYRRLPAEVWELVLDLGPGWRQMQVGVDDPTQGLLRMVRGGLRREGSGLSAAL